MTTEEQEENDHKIDHDEVIDTEVEEKHRS
jgi:hypothetical protein